MSAVNVSKESVLPVYVVDAFTKVAFEGNPAAVCPVNFSQEIPDDTKQKIAAEMNLSETVFIFLLDAKDTFETGKRFGLRWFTPTFEVPICGHATLATSAVLFHVYNNQSPVVEYVTRSGILKAKKLSDGRIEIDLPVFVSKPVDVQKYESVIKAVVGFLPLKDVLFFHPGNLMIRLSDDVTIQQFSELNPCDEALLSGASDLIGVIVTLKGTDKDDSKDNEGKAYDFFTRYFAPWAGVSEDPVCGSANSTLTPYWAKVLNKEQLYARQCSKRGGYIYCSLYENRVGLSGFSVVVLKGNIKVLL